MTKTSTAPSSTFSWAAGSRISPSAFDPNHIGQEIERIAALYHGQVTAEVLVDEARKKRSPLHPLIFHVDDAQAAQEYYLVRARAVLRHIRVDYSAVQIKPIHAFVSIDEVGLGQHIYYPTIRVLDDDQLYQRAIEQALQDLRRFRARYFTFTHLTEIIDGTLQQIAVLSAKKGRP